MKDIADQRIIGPSEYFDAIDERKKLRALCDELAGALEMGYTDTLDYIRLNHLSGSENNHWIRLARDALAKYREGK